MVTLCSGVAKEDDIAGESERLLFSYVVNATAPSKMSDLRRRYWHRATAADGATGLLRTKSSGITG